MAKTTNYNLIRLLNSQASTIIRYLKKGIPLLGDTSCYKTMQGYRRLRGIKLTSKAAMALSRRAKELSLEYDLPLRYDNSDSKPEYHIEVLDRAYNEAIDNGIFLTVKASPGGLTYVYTINEPAPITPAKQRKEGNTFNGVSITSVRICNEVGQFLIGYNDLEGTNYTKYDIWKSVLHKKIEELTGLKVKDLKKYNLSTMKPLEVRGLLGAFYTWYYPYVQKGREIAELQKPAHKTYHGPVKGKGK